MKGTASLIRALETAGRPRAPSGLRCRRVSSLLPSCSLSSFPPFFPIFFFFLKFPSQISCTFRAGEGNGGWKEVLMRTSQRESSFHTLDARRTTLTEPIPRLRLPCTLTRANLSYERKVACGLMEGIAPRTCRQT